MNVRYCIDCIETIAMPTVREIIEQEYPCPGCGVNNARSDDLTELLIALVERVDVLELEQEARTR